MTALATSSGDPNPKGYNFSCSKNCSSEIFVFPIIWVLTIPGHIALTLILIPDNSTARTFTVELIAPLDAAYKVVPGVPNNEEIEDIKTKEAPLLINFFLRSF